MDHNSARIQELKHTYFGVRKKKRILIFFLFLLNIVAAIWSMSVGSSDSTLKTVWMVICDWFVPNPELTLAEKVIVMRVRLPHVAASVLAGVMLSASGLIMQGIFQNPLVSPYTMGISNGASCGAAIAIVFSESLAFLHLDSFLTPVFAFAFSALTMYMVQALGKMANNSTKSLVLSGIAVGYLFSAIVSLIKYTCDSDKLPELVFWQMGSVSSASWPKIAIMFVIAAVGVTLLFLNAWNMNVMATGEESARSLGIDYKRTRRMAFVLCTMMTGVCVAFTGTIGFVGLVAPHVARKLVGNDYRYTVPTALVCGSLLLLVADAISRMLSMTMPLPIGVITSIVGVPFFAWIIVQKRSEVA